MIITNKTRMDLHELCTILETFLWICNSPKIEMLFKKKKKHDYQH